MECSSLRLATLWLLGMLASVAWQVTAHGAPGATPGMTPGMTPGITPGTEL
jgi:hypothetical protein